MLENYLILNVEAEITSPDSPREQVDALPPWPSWNRLHHLRRNVPRERTLSPGKVQSQTIRALLRRYDALQAEDTSTAEEHDTRSR